MKQIWEATGRCHKFFHASRIITAVNDERLDIAPAHSLCATTPPLPAANAKAASDYEREHGDGEHVAECDAGGQVV